MKTELREIYKCEHCNKLYQSKYFCEKHELSCKKRPDYIRPCHTCSVIRKQTETVWAGYGDIYGNEAERVVEILFCEKRDCFIHPPSVAAKGNAFETSKENIEMPTQCEFYTSIFDSNWLNKNI